MLIDLLKCCYVFSLPGLKYVVNSRSFKAHRAEESCDVGQILVADTCGKNYVMLLVYAYEY